MNDQALTNLANSPTPLPKNFNKAKDGFTRTYVVEAFQEAFEMIGGVKRLVMWAHTHETEFFRLYAKLLPATTVSLGDNGRYEIIHTIGPTALDRHVLIDRAIESMQPIDVVNMLAETV